jgi:short-subunit dehydrogenase
VWARALRHELDGTGVDVTIVMPGELETHLHDHQRDELPSGGRTSTQCRPGRWRSASSRPSRRSDAEVYYPGSIKALRFFQGVSPMIADRLLRLMRGKAAAPRR